MIEPGMPFPEFSLPDQDGRIWTNADLLGTRTVVYFYPKDDTPGCTVEACQFRDTFAEAEGLRVIGVSPDKPKSHAKFITKFNLNFPLLADTEKELSRAAGVWVEKSFMGKKYMGVARTTFVVDESGKVSHVWRQVKPLGHAAEVLAVLK